MPERQALPGEVTRFLGLSRAGMVAAGCLHALFLAGFAAIGDVGLAGYNVLAMAIYLVAWLLNRRGLLLLPFMLAWAEVIVHQLWATLVLGPESGFQYYLIAIFVAAAVLPHRNPALRAFLALVPLLALAALIAAANLYQPVRPPPAFWQNVFLSVNTIGVALSLFVLLAAYVRSAARAERALERAYDASERLLGNMLPAGIADRLKRQTARIADRHDHATVLFADIVGFSGLASRQPPAVLIALLDDLVSRFDDLARAHGVDKIKTIGDAWLGVAGVTSDQPDHAGRTVGLARDMMAAAAEVREPGGAPIRLRIGIASGPVLAGIIGRDRFAFDIWGETVNLAARMESEGLPGRIQIADSTRRLLGDGYPVTPRPPLAVKGMGQVSCHLLAEDRPDRD